jgi:hypothetical protein
MPNWFEEHLDAFTVGAVSVTNNTTQTGQLARIQSWVARADSSPPALFCAGPGANTIITLHPNVRFQVSPLHIG